MAGKERRKKILANTLTTIWAAAVIYLIFGRPENPSRTGILILTGIILTPVIVIAIIIKKSSD